MVSEVGAVALAAARGRGGGGIGEGGLGLPSDGAGLKVNGIRQRGRRRRRRPVLTPTRSVQVSVKGREAPPVQAADRLADPRHVGGAEPVVELAIRGDLHVPHEREEREVREVEAILELRVSQRVGEAEESHA